MRNYQQKLFDRYTVQTLPYITADTSNGIAEHLVLVYTPSLDDYSHRAWVMVEHGGGGDMYSMEWWAQHLTGVGYVVFVPTYKEGTGDSDLKDQIKAVINIGALSRFAHAKKSVFGINGGRGFSMGESYGGMTSLQFGMAQNDFDNPLFVSPVNDQNKRAKQTIIATATMPGSASSTFTDLLRMGGIPNFASHGANDPIFPIQSIRSVTDQMNRLGIKSTLTEYPAEHGLGKYYNEIFDETIKKFAGVMGIAPYVPPAVT